MTTSALLLAVACILIAVLWIGGIHWSASRELGPKAGRQWALAAAAILALFSGTHSFLAAGGVLGNFDARPPIFPFFFLSLIAMSVYVARSRFGDLLIRHVSLATLVGFQAFRILAELLILAAVHEGIAPVQMSAKGYNPDMIPAVLAIVLFFLVRNRPYPKLVQAWNALGLASLAVISVIAVTSMPLPIRQFMNEPSNIWVTTFPYVLLPSVLVTAALAGHFLVFRKLAAEKN